MEHLPEFIANHLFLCALFVALLVLLLWNIFGDSIGGNKAISPAELTTLINRENASVVDLRKQDEFNNGHIINSINIPHADIEGSLKKLEKYKKSPLVVYCQSGAESQRVSRLLKQSGFENVSFLKGGMLTWQNANLPISK